MCIKLRIVCNKKNKTFFFVFLFKKKCVAIYMAYLIFVDRTTLRCQQVSCVTWCYTVTFSNLAKQHHLFRTPPGPDVRITIAPMRQVLRIKGTHLEAVAIVSISSHV